MSFGAEARRRTGRTAQQVRIRPIGRGRFVIAQDRSAALREVGVDPDLEIAGRPEGDLGPLDFVHRRTARRGILFRPQYHEGAAGPGLPVPGRRGGRGLAPEFWWPDSGRRSAGRGWTTVARAGPSFAWSSGPWDRSSSCSGRPSRPSARRWIRCPATRSVSAGDPAALTIDGPWQVEFPEGWGAPRTTAFGRLQSWTDSAEAGIRSFSGIATYRKTFEVPAALASKRRLFLQLGDLAEIAEVTLNGKRLGVVWLPPYPDRDLRRRSGRTESAGDPGRQSLGQPAERRLVEARIGPFHPKQSRPDPDGPDIGQLLRPGPPREDAARLHGDTAADEIGPRSGRSRSSRPGTHRSSLEIPWRNGLSPWIRA
ncbi:MAG: hypothetical protein MZV63_59020 [Marinilabiliales bacterium]|nr:hypothetical protein [Marinilabiliales bacterium]